MIKIADIMRKAKKSQGPAADSDGAKPESRPEVEAPVSNQTSPGPEQTPQKTSSAPEVTPEKEQDAATDGSRARPAPSDEDEQIPAASFLFAKSHKDEAGHRQLAKNPEAVSRALRESEANQEEIASQTYQRGLELAKETVKNAKNNQFIKIEPVVGWLNEIIREFNFGHEDLISLTFRTGEDAEVSNYIYQSMVNVAILSVRIEIGRKKLNKSKLIEVGLVGFFHDIGIVKVLDLALKKDPLTAKDRDEIKEHPHHSVEILKKVDNLTNTVIKGVYQTHERMDGSGYPAGLDDDRENISELARSVAVVDIFEALTHDRPSRKAVPPQEALKYILELGANKKLDQAVLRALIDQVGLYPVGSWVELSNDETGKVVAINAGQPLRPKVKILFDECGKTFDSDELEVIDLGKNPLLGIVKTLSDKDKKKLGIT